MGRVATDGPRDFLRILAPRDFEKCVGASDGEPRIVLGVRFVVAIISNFLDEDFYGLAALKLPDHPSPIVFGWSAFVRCYAIGTLFLGGIFIEVLVRLEGNFEIGRVIRLRGSLASPEGM